MIWSGERMHGYFKHMGESKVGYPGFVPVPGIQIQPNGIDMTVDRLFKQYEGPSLSEDERFREDGQLHELNAVIFSGLDREGWFLTPGFYVVEWTEIIEVPENVVGFMSPRSTLLKQGVATVHSAFLDRGYRGKGRSGLQIFTDWLLARGTRIAQMCFIEAESGEQPYEGQYQDENVP